jgi:hypothetical protein
MRLDPLEAKILVDFRKQILHAMRVDVVKQKILVHL